MLPEERLSCATRTRRNSKTVPSWIKKVTSGQSGSCSTGSGAPGAAQVVFPWLYTKASRFINRRHLGPSDDFFIWLKVIVFRHLIFIFFFVAVSATSIKVTQSASVRHRPLFGYGSEFLFQTVTDSGLNTALTAAASELSRYPGGTPSDYWLWDEGWINKTGSSGCGGCGAQPLRPTTPSTLRAYLTATHQDTIFVLNQLNSNVSYQIAGLHAYGTPRYIELGNEMYDSTRPDILAKYPLPNDYAKEMASWTSAVKSAFPLSLVALVGWRGGPGDNRTATWNQQVLQNSVSAQADAATIHVYPGLPSTASPISPTQFPGILAVAFSEFTTTAAYVNDTIPPHFRLWVTEWGTWGNDAILNTWLQGLWHGAFTLLMATVPRIDIILPYCAVCGDPAMPSFTTPTYGPIVPPSVTNATWTRTPSGHVYALVFLALQQDAQMAPLNFDVNPVLDPSVPGSVQLIGAVGLRLSHVHSLVVINLGATDANLDLTGLGLVSASCVASVYSCVSVVDVARQDLAVSDLVNTTVPCGDFLTVPSYGAALVVC